MYPDKLICWFPEYVTRDYRRVLSGIDDALVVHRRRESFIFDLRERVRIASEAGYGKLLLSLAADLQANYAVSIIDRDMVLDDLVARATASATRATLPAIEAAVLTVTERTRYQLLEFRDGRTEQNRVGHMIVAARKRNTSVDHSQANGVNWQNGIHTPRSEQMWHSMAGEHLDPREYQMAKSAWEHWARRNRPPMPRLVA